MQDNNLLAMYNDAVTSMERNLVFGSADGSIAFLAEIKDGHIHKSMEHLSCFVPGMLALGATAFDPTKNKNYAEDRFLRKNERDLQENSHDHIKLAKQLINGCVESYNAMPTGLGPERFSFNENAPASQQIRVEEGRYILRPETVESLLVMYRTTGDDKYRQIGWRFFEAINRHCRTESSYSGIKDVRRIPAEPNNSMQSFFLAETLKYLYLLFSDPSVMAMDEYIWTTEAHPLPTFTFNHFMDENGMLHA